MVTLLFLPLSPLFLPLSPPLFLPSPHSTASATMRQAVALIFNRVLEEQGLPAASGARATRTASGTPRLGTPAASSQSPGELP